MKRGTVRWLVVLGILGAAVVSLLLGSLLSHGAEQPQPSDGPHSRSDQVPDAPVAVSSELPGRSRQGAVEVALGLASAPQRWMYLSDADLTEDVRTIASRQSADRLTAEIVAEVRLARDALRRSPGRVWWIVRPLAWRVETFAADRARVSVWTVSVLSAADVAVPQADWATTAVDLVWEDNAWRLLASRDTPGPTPRLGGRDAAWEPEPFDTALEGFHRVGTEAGE